MFFLLLEYVVIKLELPLEVLVLRSLGVGLLPVIRDNSLFTITGDFAFWVREKYPWLCEL